MGEAAALHGTAGEDAYAVCESLDGAPPASLSTSASTSTSRPEARPEDLDGQRPFGGEVLVTDPTDIPAAAATAVTDAFAQPDSATTDAACSTRRSPAASSRLCTAGVLR